MALDDKYLPSAKNELPAGFADLFQAPDTQSQQASSLPAGFADILQPQAQEEQPGVVVGSVKRGAANTFGSLANLVGAESLAAEANKYAADYPKRIAMIQDVKDVSDLGLFAVESGLENLANLVAMVGAGVATAYTGGGFAAGAFAANLALQAGEAKQTIQAEGGEVNLATVGVPAVINTAMDTLSFLKVARSAGVLSKVSKILDESAEVSGIAGRTIRGVKAGATSFGVEGSTEAAQNYVNMVAAKLAADQEVKDAFALQGKDIDEMVNAFAAGGLGAAVTAGPLAAVFTQKGETNETADKGSRKAPHQKTETTPDRPQTETPPQEGAGPVIDEPPAGSTIDETSEHDVQGTIQATLDNIGKTREELENEEGIESPHREHVSYNYDPYLPAGTRYTKFVNGEAVEMTRDDINMAKAGGVHFDMANFGKNLPTEALTRIDEYVNTLIRRYLPGRDFILSSVRTLDVNKEAPNADGILIRMKLMSKQNFADRDSFGIGIALDKMLDNEGNLNETYMMETISHEFGHALAYDKFTKESPEVQSGILKEFYAWQKKMIESNAYDALVQQAGPYSASLIPNWLKGKTLREVLDDDQYAYYTSFEEFMANQFARLVGRDGKLKKEMSRKSKSFWADIYEVMKELYVEMKQYFAPETNFAKWATQIQQGNAVALLETLPLESTKIPQEILDMLPDDLIKFKPRIDAKLDGVERIVEMAKALGLSPEHAEAIGKLYRVTTGFTRKLAGKLLTPSQIAERYKNTPARRYMDEVYKFHTTKMKGISAADSVASKWTTMSTSEADSFANFVFDVSDMSDQKRRKLTEEEILELRKKHKISESQMEIFREMETTFDEVSTRLYNAIIKDTAAGYLAAEDIPDFLELYNRGETEIRALAISAAKERAAEFAGALARVEKQFRKMRDRNYFPRMRFGSYTITVKERKIDSNGKERWEVTEFQTFESAKERDALLKEMLNDAAGDKDVHIQGSKLDDTVRSLYGMPQVVIDRIEKTMQQADGGMSPEQAAVLREISLDLSPGKRFMRHMAKRKNTKGFSREALRTYAAYMSNASNHLARVEHSADMVAALRVLRQMQKGPQGDVTDLAELDAYYTEHFRYLLNPENDWAKLRSFGFLWYLGFNPKSALVNLTQLPMVTYPFLASRYGDAKTTRALAAAMADVTRHYKDRAGLPEAEQRLLDRLLEEGIIDESMVADLTGLAEGTALSRIIPTNTAHRVINNINHYGASMFRPAEKYNRLVTALAAYRLNTAQTESFDQGYAAAKEAIHKSQFEYARYNRPEFMRGKKSAFFLFYNYTQQFMYLALAGAKTKEARGTAFRMWALLFVFAGVQGLPFAEYILSTLDILGTKIKRWTGMDNPMVNVRQDMRELLDDLGTNPDIIMHGGGRYLGAGPLKLLEAFGVPVPNLDITGSLSMGQPLPGLRTESLSGSPEEMAGQLLLDAGGPIPNIAISMFNALSSTDPDTWKNFEKALPVAAKNISKASRYAMRGMETSRGGAEFLLYDGSDPYHIPEIIGQAMGFTATRLSQKRETYGEQMTTALYWVERRQLLMERYAYATKTGDSRMKRSTMEDIITFNKALTNKELTPYRISRSSLTSSLRTKLKALSKRERGLPTNDRDRLVYSAMEKGR